MVFHNISNNFAYTGDGGRTSNCKDFNMVEQPRRVAKIKPGNVDEDDSDEIHGEGNKISIPPNIIDFWNRLEVLLGLKLRGQTDNLTEASNLIDKFIKKDKI